MEDDFDSYESFERALRRLDMTSSPGYPYCREATTNGQWLRWTGVDADAVQKMRLWADVRRVMVGDFPNYVRVFIKEEPHKLSKVQEDRWRLILASSLPVQMFWHMLFDQLNDREIDKSYYIPSQQGFKSVGGAWKQYTRSWKQQGKTCGVDKSAWDWTCPWWLLEAELELRARLARGARLEEWATHARRMYRDMFANSILVLSSGASFHQVVPGVMKSGCVNTISTNSHCQVILHLVACFEAEVDPFPLPSACGDDTIQHPRHDVLRSVYERHGVIIKSISDNLEFMGHEFGDSGPRPLYFKKHLYKMKYTPDEILPQYFDSMARMYVHADEYVVWETLAELNGTPLPLSRRAYLYWYDYEQL